jgi:hypothetical protein
MREFLASALVIAVFFVVVLQGCQQEIAGVIVAGLPPGAMNVQKRGNNWCTFEQDIDGYRYTFLYRYNVSGNATTEVLTVLYRHLTPPEEPKPSTLNLEKR